MKNSHAGIAWIVAAVALGIGLALAVGLAQGALVVPAKGFVATIQRATNPAAFYATAAFYAVLAVASVWLLVAILRADREVQPSAARAATRTRPARTGEFPGRIGYAQSGREGAVVVELPGGRYEFYWEIGGGDCIAIVSVPGAGEWSKHSALAAHPRDAFLAALAREVGAAQCPSARIEITPDAILFRH
jgi:hypothetical protein